MRKKGFARKKKKFLRALVCTILFGAVAAIVWFLFISPYFHFGSVTVTGNKNVSREEILNIAGIEEPINILQLWSYNIEKRLNGDLRLIGAQVNFEFPNRLQIGVSERKALAYMVSDYGYVLIDGDAMVIAYVKAIVSTSVPIITGKKAETVFIGDKIEISQLQKVLEFLEMLPDSALADISEINMREDGTYLLYMLNGIKVRLGKLDDLESKNKLFLEILTETKKNNLNVEYIDVDYNPPVIKLKGKG